MAASGISELLMTRVFGAPRERVYRAFTDPDQFALWFGPAGFSVPRDSVDIDARVGGHQRFLMVSDDDPDVTSAVDATFTAVIENELLIGSESDDDITGDMYLRLDFGDESGQTRLALRQGPYTEEMATVARDGWNSSFTKLDALLAG